MICSLCQKKANLIILNLARLFKMTTLIKRQNKNEINNIMVNNINPACVTKSFPYFWNKFIDLYKK